MDFYMESPLEKSEKMISSFIQQKFIGPFKVKQKWQFLGM
jgi:hypothetical protein